MFCCGKDNDVLVACADHSIRIVKSDTGATVATLKSHRARMYAPFSLSVCSLAF